MGNDTSQQEDENRRLKKLVRQVMREKSGPERNNTNDHNEILLRVMDLLEQNEANRARGHQQADVDDLTFKLQKLLERVNVENRKPQDRNQSIDEQMIFDAIAKLGARTNNQQSVYNQPPGPTRVQGGGGSYQDHGATRKQQFKGTGTHPKRFQDKEYVKPKNEGKHRGQVPGPFDNLGPSEFQNKGQGGFQNKGPSEFQNKGRGDFHNKSRGGFQEKGKNERQSENKGQFENKGRGQFYDKTGGDFPDKGRGNFNRGRGNFQGRGQSQDRSTYSNTGQVANPNPGPPPLFPNQGQGLFSKPPNFSHQGPGYVSNPDNNYGMSPGCARPPYQYQQQGRGSYPNAGQQHNQNPGYENSPADGNYHGNYYGNSGPGQPQRVNQDGPEGSYESRGRSEWAPDRSYERFHWHNTRGARSASESRDLNKDAQKPGPKGPYNGHGAYPKNGPNGAQTKGPKNAQAKGPNNAQAKGPNNAQAKGFNSATSKGPNTAQGKPPKKTNAVQQSGKEGVLVPETNASSKKLASDNEVDSDASCSSAVAPGVVVKVRKRNNNNKKNKQAMKKASSLTDITQTLNVAIPLESYDALSTITIQPDSSVLVASYFASPESQSIGDPIVIPDASASVVDAGTRPVPQPRKRTIVPVAKDVIDDVESAPVGTDDHDGDEVAADDGVDGTIETVEPPGGSAAVPLQLFVGAGFNETMADKMDPSEKIQDVMLIAKVAGTIVTCTPTTLGELRAFKLEHPFAEVIVVRSSNE